MSQYNKLNGLTLKQAKLLKAGLLLESQHLKPNNHGSAQEQSERFTQYENQLEDINYLIDQLEDIIIHCTQSELSEDINK